MLLRDPLPDPFNLTSMPATDYCLDGRVPDDGQSTLTPKVT